MSLIKRAPSSRHLVDPELGAVLDAFPPFDVGPATLLAVRERMAVPRPGAPDPADLYPGVARTDHVVPGLEGEPDVPVLVFAPAQRTGPTGALVWMHGGGYVFGAATDEEFVARQIVTQTGAVVISVDYRLAPETRAPGAVLDCYAALSWTHANSGDLQVDRSLVAVGGSSAGGGLAAALAILARDRGEFPVSFQALVYPMLDDRTAVTAEPHPYAGEFVWTPADSRFGWASLIGPRAGGDDVSPYAAPARVEDASGLPAAFLCVGALDLFAEEDIEYARRLLRAGVPTELHVYPGGFHGYNMAPTARVAAAHSRNLLSALDRHFNG
jgi:acetyl esterase/lipase